ncbi:MAG: exodeoxyribonuclease VII large subunit [Candidatus Eisenbacteria bacterium]
MALLPSQEDRMLSVGELTRAIKETLTDAFPGVWVKGEVSGLKRPDSGHLYFSLKEGTTAVIACAMWRNAAMKLGFPLRDGGEVEAYGEIDVYAPRGAYQLIIRQMRPAGIGALLLQLEELKRRLAAEGLFDAERKRPLPRYPRRIGLVTSPVGAAVRDVIKVLRARWPGIEVVLAPVKVQGEGAANEIAAAIERFNRYGRVDVLIVGRGGGSMEDLWAFNEEAVVRAIAGSAIPVISAVGHEVDTTLADFAADLRAATPSNAAELAVRDALEMAHRVRTLEERATRAMRNTVSHRRRVLEALLGQYGFRRVRDVFTTLQQRVDDLRERIDAAVRAELTARRERVESLARAYGLREYPRALQRRRESIDALKQRLESCTVSTVLDAKRRVSAFEDRLRALSPRLVLERGYTFVRTADGRLVRGVDALNHGDRVTIEFARGDAVAAIETIRKGGA